MKWIGQHIVDLIAKFRNKVDFSDTVNFSEDVTFYQPVNNADPKISIGASDDERLLIKVNYQGTASQTAQQIIFKTLTESGTAHDGNMVFQVDEVEILRMQDNGIKLAAGMGIAINGASILTDSSGTATLSNIDNLDATTIATFEAALETNIDTLDNPLGITIDTDRSAEEGELRSENVTALHIDFDRIVPTSGTHEHNDTGIDLDVTSSSLGTSTLKGMDIDVVGTADGTSTATGIELNVSGAETNIGMQILCEGEQLRLSHNSEDYATFTVADTGDLTIATVGDGTRDSDLILDADGQIKLEPAAGNNILLDGTIAIDAGVVTGATSITSTAFVGNVTGDVSGTALSVTQAAQTAITSLGTLTALAVDDIRLNDKTIIITGDTDDTFSITTGAAGATTLTTIDDNAEAGHFEIAADGNITLDAAGNIALETVGGSFDCDAAAVNFTGTGADRPSCAFINNANDATGPNLFFRNMRDGNGLEDSDVLGTIHFAGEDAAGASETYGNIIGSVIEADHGDEAGQIAIYVANDGAERNGITMTADKATATEVDVTIANGAASTTTIAGTLTMGSTAFVNNSGVIQVATQGTIDHDSLANFVANEHVDWAGSSAGTIHSSNIPTLNQDTTGKAAAVTLGSGSADANHAVVFSVDTGADSSLLIDAGLLYNPSTNHLIANGGFTGNVSGNCSGNAANVTGVVASANLDADTAHLSGTQTFTGTKTLNSFKGTGGATVTNILDEDAMGSNSATALATQQSIKAYADTKRPNLYWFGVCDEATAAGNANLGAFPSTDVSIVSFLNTTLTNDTDVFTLDTDEVTITRAGVYKFTYNVLLEISTGNNRTEGAIGILRNRASTITLVEGSRSSTYNRFGRADSDDVSRTAGSVSMFIDVAVDDIFYIGFFKEAHQTSNTRLQTVPSGTTWTIEAVT